MSMIDIDRKDKFWNRVRSLLTKGAAGRGAGGAAMLRGFDRRQGSGRPIEEELQGAWMLAAERRVSLCVMALEIDCFSDYLTAYGRDAADDCLEALDQAISPLLKRDTDRCLRVAQSGFVLVLPDMPLLLGRDLANRITLAVRRAGLVNKESHAGTVTLGAGMAVVNPQPPYDRGVLETARLALRRAQRRGLSRLDIADLRNVEDRKLVAA